MNTNLPRFFCVDNFLLANLNKTIILPKNIFQHAILALRLKINQQIVLFDNSGNEFIAKIVNIQKHNAEILIENFQEISRESTLEITLIQAIQSGDKMDFTLQKATELGVKNIIPVISERSQWKSQNIEKTQKKITHWQNILISSCEQCGRNEIPKLAEICALKNLLQNFSNTTNTKIHSDLNLLATPHKNQQTISLKNLAENTSFQPKHITLLIGAEGGFSDAEIELANQANFKNFVLGKRILRTETAGLAIISALQTLWGDFLA